MRAPNRVLPAAVAAIALLAPIEAGAQAARGEPLNRPPTHEVQATAAEKKPGVLDVLDFDVFSGRKWARLCENHAEDIVVPGAADHGFNGIDKHHPIRLGRGTWTLVRLAPPRLPMREILFRDLSLYSYAYNHACPSPGLLVRVAT